MAQAMMAGQSKHISSSCLLHQYSIADCGPLLATYPEYAGRSPEEIPLLRFPAAIVATPTCAVCPRLEDTEMVGTHCQLAVSRWTVEVGSSHAFLICGWPRAHNLRGKSFLPRRTRLVAS